jgi:catechol 2,3-dioxygenase-like lactoylglutathione lyase family enzyme
MASKAAAPRRCSNSPTIGTLDTEDYGEARYFGPLAFEVDDIYAVCDRLMKAGVTINRPPRDGTMAFVRSPDRQSRGNRCPTPGSGRRGATPRPTPEPGRGPPLRVLGALAVGACWEPKWVEVHGGGGSSRLPNQGHRIDQPSPNFSLARWPCLYWVTLRDSISM